MKFKLLTLLMAGTLSITCFAKKETRFIKTTTLFKGVVTKKLEFHCDSVNIQTASEGESIRIQRICVSPSGCSYEVQAKVKNQYVPWYTCNGNWGADLSGL